MLQNLFAFHGSRDPHMFLKHFLHIHDIVLRGNLPGGHHGLVDLGIQVIVLVEYIGNTARHARRKVLANRAQNQCLTARHILTAMIAAALDHCIGSGIADAEPLACGSADISAARGCPVQGDISDNDVRILAEPGRLRRIDHKLAAGKSLSEIVVAVALQLQRQPLRDERAEALAARSLTADVEGIVRKRIAVPLRDLRAEDRAECPVCIADTQAQRRLLTLLKRMSELFKKDLLIQCVLQLEVIDLLRVKCDAHLPRVIRIVQDRRQINLLPPLRQIVAHLEQI